MIASLYFGKVRHTRLRPKSHKFKYSVFSVFLDLDKLDSYSKNFNLFGYNKFAPISFYDSDHGPEDGGLVSEWIRRYLKKFGFSGNGKIFIQCYPRIFGYVFNPIATYFCYSAEKKLEAVVYEVRNTFKQKHCYVLPVVGCKKNIRQNCYKSLHVSPFNEMDHTYSFKLYFSLNKFFLSVVERDAFGDLLIATFSANRVPFTEKNLAWALIKFPLMTFKVIAAIHFEALKLWIKGVPLVKKPKSSPPQISHYNGDHSGNKKNM